MNVTATNRFSMLLRREYWEHRGGFFWAPVWTAIVVLGFALIGMGLVLWHSSGQFNGEVHFGIPLKRLVSEMSAKEMSYLPAGFDVGLTGFWTLVQTVLFFVLFFYALGSLYDDRKDRSVLFWKSLPISDSSTVLSKVVTALFVAPIIAFAVTVALHLGFLVLLSIFVAVHGVSPFELIWGPAEPTALWVRMAAAMLVNAIWALPTLGWLMLVSAYARSKPFLWALALPIGTGIALSISDVLETIKIPESWYWTDIVGRLLGSLVPNSWILSDDVRPYLVEGRDGPPQVLTWDAIGRVLASPDLWIGAVAGIAMLVGAVYFRRRRELAD